jgi:hypothetical protein
MERALVCAPTFGIAYVPLSKGKVCEYCWITYGHHLGEDDPFHYHMHHYGHWFATVAHLGGSTSEENICHCGRTING